MVVVGGTVLGATVLHNLFGIEPFTVSMIGLFAGCALAGLVAFQLLFGVLDRWHAKRQEGLV